MLFCLVTGQEEGFDFMKYMWYKFMSEFISAMSTKSTLTTIHVITSFWGLSETRKI